MSCVYEYDPSFSYNENPTRVLNTTSLTYCLPSTDTIDRREKSRMHMKVRRPLMQVRLTEIQKVFAKNKAGYFSNKVVYIIIIIRSQEKNLNQNRDSNLGPPDF